MTYKPRIEQLEARRLLTVFGPSWKYLPSGVGNAIFDCISAKSCLIIQNFAGTNQASLSYFADQATSATWTVKRGDEEVRFDSERLDGDQLRLVTINPKGPSFSGTVYNAGAPRLRVSSQWDQDPNDNVIGPFLYSVSLANKFSLHFEPALPADMTVHYRWGDGRAWEEGTSFERNIASFPAGPTALNVQIMYGGRALHTYNVAATVSVLNSLAYDLSWQDSFGNSFNAEDTRFIAGVDAGAWTAVVSASYLPTPQAYQGYEFALGIFDAKNPNRIWSAMPLELQSATAGGIVGTASQINVGRQFQDLVPGVAGVDYVSRLIARPKNPQAKYSRGFTNSIPIETTVVPTWMHISAAELNRKVRYMELEGVDGTTAGYAFQIPAVNLKYEFPTTTDTPFGIFDGRRTFAETGVTLTAHVSPDRSTDPEVVAAQWKIIATLLDTTLTSQAGNLFPESHINVAAILEPHTLSLDGGGIHLTATPLVLASNKTLASKSKNVLDLTLPVITTGAATIDARLKLNGDLQVKANTISGGAEILLRDSAAGLVLDRDQSYVGLFVDGEGEARIHGTGSLGIAAGISLPAGTSQEIKDEVARFEVLRLVAEGKVTVGLAGVVQANFAGAVRTPAIDFQETNVTAKGKAELKYDTCFFSEKTRKFLGMDPCGTELKPLFVRDYGPVELLRGASSNGNQGQQNQSGEGEEEVGTSAFQLSTATRSLDNAHLIFGPDSAGGRVAELVVENTSNEILVLDALEIVGDGFRLIDPPPGARGLLPDQSLRVQIEATEPVQQMQAQLRIRGGGAVITEQTISLVQSLDHSLTDNRAYHPSEIFSHTEGSDWTYAAASRMGPGAFRFLAGPAHAQLDSATGQVVWSPTENYLPGRYHFVIQRESASGQITTRNIAVDLRKSNTAPRFQHVSGVEVQQYQTAIIPLSATDVDFPAQKLSFKLIGETPAGLSLDSRNQIVWTPDASVAPGIYSIAVQVSDSGENPLSSSVVVPITVLPVSLPPFFVQEYHVQATENVPFELTVAAIDLDSAPPKYQLQYDHPQGVSLDEATGLLSWTPSESDGGRTHRLTVAAIDADDPSLAAYTTVWIHVQDVPSPLVLAPVETPAQVIPAGIDVDLSFDVYDQDDVPLYVEYSLVSADDPEASIHYQTGVFHWRPTTSGNHRFTILATGYGAGIVRNAVYELDLTVLEDDIPPVLELGMPAKVASPLLTVEATDNLGVDELTFRFARPVTPWTNISWEGFVAVVDEFMMSSLLQDALVPGEYEIEVRAVDRAGNSVIESRTFLIDDSLPDPATVVLAPHTDSLPLNDERTSFEIVSLAVTTEPFATVVISPQASWFPDVDASEFLVQGEADSNGHLQIDGVRLPRFGKNQFDVTTFNTVGNSVVSTLTISRLTTDGVVGPDGFGYQATRSEVDFSSIADPSRRMPFDDGSPSITLSSDDLPGFAFPFYGTIYHEVFVGRDGVLAFGAPIDEYPSRDYLPTPASMGVFWTPLQFVETAHGVHYLYRSHEAGDDKVLTIEWHGLVEVSSESPDGSVFETVDARFSVDLHSPSGNIVFNYDQILPQDGQFRELTESVFVKDVDEEAIGQRALVLSQSAAPFDLVDNHSQTLIELMPEPRGPFLIANWTEDYFYNGISDYLIETFPLVGRTFDSSAVVSLVWNDPQHPDQPIELIGMVDERGYFSIDRESLQSAMEQPLADGTRFITLVATDSLGLQTELQVELLVDETPPLLDSWQPAPGQAVTSDGDKIFTTSSKIDFVGTTEPLATVRITLVEGVEYFEQADENGNFLIADVDLQTGENEISIEIVDRWGNISVTTKSIELVDSLAPLPQPLIGNGNQSSAGYVAVGALVVDDPSPMRLELGEPDAFVVRRRPGVNAIDLGSDAIRFPHGVITGQSQLFVSTDGFVTLGERLNVANLAEPSLDQIGTRIIAPLWSQWLVDPSGDDVVLAKFERDRGVGLPDRLVIQWNVYNFSHSPRFEPSLASFQLVLELNTEKPTRIGFQYFDLELLATADGAAYPALIGLRMDGDAAVAPVILQPYQSVVPKVVSHYRVTWENDLVAASFELEQPNPFVAPSIVVNFTEDVTGVDERDFQWTRNEDMVDPGDVVVSGSGSRYLVTPSGPLAPGHYTVTLKVDGSIQAANKTLASSVMARFFVAAANHPPTDILLDGSQLPGGASQAVIGSIATVDVDPHAVTIWTTSDPRFFVDDGRLQFAALEGADPWFEPEIEVVVTAVENGWISNSISKSFTITVGASPMLPRSIQLIGSSVDERISGAFVGNLGATDRQALPGIQFSTHDPRFFLSENALWLNENAYLDLSSGPDAWVEIRIERESSSESRIVRLPIGLKGNSFPFHNRANKYDVNANGEVSAIDALMVINALSRGKYPEGVLPQARHGVFEANHFYDVSEDNLITSIDALTIINFLSRKGSVGGGGEAEIASDRPLTSASPAYPEPLAVDAVWSRSHAILDWLRVDDEEWGPRTRLF